MAAAAEGPYKRLIPSVFLGERPPEGLRAGKIDPNTHNAWRRGQFNAVSFYKLGAVRRVLRHGYQVPRITPLLSFASKRGALFAFLQGA